MAYGFVPIIHIVAAVLAVIELGLTAYVVSALFFSTDRANFMLFNSIWTLLVLAYVGVAPLYYTRIFHRLASLALEAITMLFWFAGSIALAVVSNGHCGSIFCGAVKAAVAFGFFLWYVTFWSPGTETGAPALTHALPAGSPSWCSSSSTPSSRSARAAMRPTTTSTSPPPTPACRRQRTLGQQCDGRARRCGAAWRDVMARVGETGAWNLAEHYGFGIN